MESQARTLTDAGSTPKSESNRPNPPIGTHLTRPSPRTRSTTIRTSQAKPKIAIGLSSAVRPASPPASGVVRTAHSLQRIEGAAAHLVFSDANAFHGRMQHAAILQQEGWTGLHHIVDQSRAHRKPSVNLQNLLTQASLKNQPLTRFRHNCLTYPALTQQALLEDIQRCAEDNHQYDDGRTNDLAGRG